MVIGFGRYIASRKYGNVKMADGCSTMAIQCRKSARTAGLAGFHHMGTTRMASTPDKGVVDENCGVFGLDNLFIAGSSVFPTCSHANPTLPIVQLTLRLGEHLAGKIKT